MLEDLLPGPYTASVRDPRLAALDVPSTTTLRLSAVRDSTIDARVVVESADDYVMKRCGYDAVPIGMEFDFQAMPAELTADGSLDHLASMRWTMEF